MLKAISATLLFLFVLNFSAAQANSLFNKMENSWEVPDIFFKDALGREKNLREYIKNELQGRYVLLNLWASWCTPCVSEMPSLDKLQSLMKNDKLEVIALNVDRNGDTVVPAFYRRNGLNNLKIFWTASSYPLRSLRAKGIPTTLLISPSGKEIGRVSRNIDWAKPENIAQLKQIISAVN